MVVMALSIGYHHDRKGLEAGRLANRGKKQQEGPEEESMEREGNRGEKEKEHKSEDRKEDTGRRYMYR